MNRFRPKLSTILLCLCLFVFFLILRFPYQNFRGYIFGKIYAATRILIVAEEIYPSFFGWPGVGIRNVNVTLPMGSSELDIASEKLIFRVGLGGLFPPVPSVSMNMKKLKKGGDLYLKFSQSASAFKAKIDAEGVVLDQLEFSALPEPISGKFTADGDVHIDRKELARSTGYVELNIDKFRVPALNMQGFILPALKVGAIKGKINLRNGLAEFSSFTFGSKDADMSGSISGDIRLGQDLMASFINITLRLQLSDAYRQNPGAATLVSLLESFRSGPGDYAMKWSASLQTMSSNLITAIPQKVN